MKKPVVIKHVDNNVGDERLRSFIDTMKIEIQQKLDSDTLPWRHHALSRQLERTNKKCEFMSNSEELRDAALNKFILTNEEVGNNKELSFELDPTVISNARLFITSALERFTKSRIKDSIQDPLNLTLLLTMWKYGPGSSRGTKHTHFADKIGITKPTVTSDALPLAKLLRVLNPHTAAFDSMTDVGYTLVEGSSMNTVPKNETVHRTICTEPVLNMALQLSAGMYIEGALRQVGIDISKQQCINKAMAELSSIANDLATLDLSMASDYISIELIKLLWPHCWFELMMKIRSPSTKINGVEHTLNMMSTMGNGFTFPMMTLTLLALIYGAQSAKFSRSMFVNYQQVAVYGDDIICPVNDYDKVCKVLRDARLVVNLDKSYADGSFRESCGGDFVNGYNITPFYVSSLLNDAQVYVAINGLLTWCGTHKVSLFKTLNLLISFLHKPKEPFLVPVWHDPSDGILYAGCKLKYKHLSVYSDKSVKIRKSSKTPWPILVLMMTGQYIKSAGNDRYLYYPRRETVDYEVTTAKLPRGRLDGSAPFIRGRDIENWIHAILLHVLVT